jgi:hypothetical protein
MIYNLVMANDNPSIDEIFSVTFKKTFDPTAYGARSKLAKQVGLSAAQFNKLCLGASATSEDTRRKIAIALGFDDYEAFLDIGRVSLGLKSLSKTSSEASELDRNDNSYFLEEKLKYLNQIQVMGQLICDLQQENKDLKHMLNIKIGVINS